MDKKSLDFRTLLPETLLAMPADCLVLGNFPPFLGPQRREDS